jgi:hypothetical protein
MTKAQGPTDVTWPAWVINPTCSVARLGLSAQDPQRAIHLSCPADNNAAVSCNGENIEPVDILGSDVCRTRTLPLIPAMSVTVMGAQHRDLVIEWLSLKPDGRLTTVATRTQPANDVIRLRVGALPDRLVRFRREAASPVTVHALELVNSAWTLPESVPGGELVILTETAPILPVSYHLRGTLELDITRSSSLLSVAGLPSGVYKYAPTYEGGVRGQSREMSVRDTESTAVLATKENIGAISASGDPNDCASATEFGVLSVVAPGDGSRRSRSIIRTPDTSACHWEIGGLEPGSYEAFLKGDGFGVSRSVVVQPQRLSTVTFERPMVRVSGQVLYNAKPLNAATVEFVHPDKATGILASIDAGGKYSAKLESSGPYVVTLRGESLAPQRKKVTLRDGDNEVNWSFNGATLTVRLKGWDHATPAFVNISSSSLQLSASFQLNPWDEPVLTRNGLGFGLYRVSARQGRFVTPADKEIALDKDHPNGELDLELVSSQSILVVRDIAGNPVSGARIVGLFPQPRQIEPGYYELLGIVPGTPLIIKPPAGLAPVCKRALLDKNVEVTLVPGSSVAAKVADPSIQALTLNAGSITGIPGSDCAVPLADFQWMHVSTRGPESIFIISNFPNVDGLALASPSGGGPIPLFQAREIRLRPFRP